MEDYTNLPEFTSVDISEEIIDKVAKEHWLVRGGDKSQVLKKAVGRLACI